MYSHEIPIPFMTINSLLSPFDKDVNETAICNPPSCLCAPIIPCQSGNDIFAPDAVNWIMRRRFTENSKISHNKTLQRFFRGGLTLDIAFRPHPSLEETTLYELQVGGARQPSLDVLKIITIK